MQTYLLASDRMVRAVRGVVTTPLIPLVVLGLLMLPPAPDRARIWLFFGIVLLGSALGLVRLHATGGYCTIRHALIPGMLLTLTAAHCLVGLMARISLPGRCLGAVQGRLRPGPAVWAILLAVLIITPRLHGSGQLIPGPFHRYRDAGAWLALNAEDHERALDLTDWSLFFSQRPGYPFADVLDAPADSSLRWVVARKPDLEGHWNYSSVVRQLVGQRDPVVRIPENPEPGQLQILIFDRLGPTSQVAAMNATGQAASTLR